LGFGSDEFSLTFLHSFLERKASISENLGYTSFNYETRRTLASKIRESAERTRKETDAEFVELKNNLLRDGLQYPVVWIFVFGRKKLLQARPALLQNGVKLNTSLPPLNHFPLPKDAFSNLSLLALHPSPHPLFFFLVQQTSHRDML